MDVRIRYAWIQSVKASATTDATLQVPLHLPRARSSSPSGVRRLLRGYIGVQGGLYLDSGFAFLGGAR